MASKGNDNLHTEKKEILLEKFLENENKQIDYRRRRLEIDKHAIDANDKENQRNYDLSNKNLDYKQENKKSEKRTKNILLSFGYVIILLVLVYSFYLINDEKTRDFGKDLLSHFVTLLVGIFGGVGLKPYLSSSV